MSNSTRRELIKKAVAAGMGTVAADDVLGLATKGSEPAQMEKVSGIGGLFFRARDPAAMGRWYRDKLGIALVPSNYDELPWSQEAGPTVFAPFPETTEYFGDANKVWMVNFRVRNLDAMVAQLRAAGVAVEVDQQRYPNGRFAHLKDPEGNPIELWEPKGRDAAR